MATLKDIAKLANVNVSTVSKALRNSNDLNPRTVNEIRKIADQLNYPYKSQDVPDTKIPAIGVVCPEIISLYYTNIVDSIHSNLFAKKYDTIFMVSDFSAEQEMKCIELLIKSNVSGIICITEMRENASKFKDISELNDITFLLVSTVGDNDFCHKISINDRQGAVMAVKHLTGLNHKRIAYIGDSLSSVRRDAYIDTLRMENIDPVEDYIVENEYRFEECGYMGMKKLLSLGKDLPTGIFAAYDNIAIGAMRAIYERGLSVPEDFSVIGIDNIKVSQYLYKGLTTVNEPTADLGEIATKLLLDKISDKNKTVQHVTLNPTLNIRETTSSPRSRLLKP